MEQQQPALDIVHLTKTYKKTTAVSDVSFTLPSGSVTALLGPNGAGKSTLIKSVVGFLRFTGDIAVYGYPNNSPAARRLLGYVPELPALYPNLTVEEHMEFLARAYKLHDYKDRIDMLFDRFELNDKRKKFGDELSKGMQQKLSLCLGLLPSPRVLLLDEPMIGLDPHAIKELKELILKMRNEGRALLISTHMIDSVDMLMDRTIILQNGTLRRIITRDEVESGAASLADIFYDITEGTIEEIIS